MNSANRVLVSEAFAEVDVDSPTAPLSKYGWGDVIRPEDTVRRSTYAILLKVRWVCKTFKLNPETTTVRLSEDVNANEQVIVTASIMPRDKPIVLITPNTGNGTALITIAGLPPQRFTSWNDAKKALAARVKADAELAVRQGLA